MTLPVTTAQMAALEAVVRDRLAEWPRQWEGFHWPGYTYEHTERVRALARKLAQAEGADTLVVDLAALLHDLAKPEGAGHAQVGAVEAAELMRGLGLDGSLVERVEFAIATHSGDNTPEHPVENRVLGDADLIDANFGLVATWRFITIRAGHHSTLEDTILGFAGWLPRKDELMGLLRSDAGRAVSRERSATMHSFCEHVADEYAASGDGPLVRWVAAVARQCERASLVAQLPGLNDGHPATLAVCERLRAEMAGEC